MQFPVVLPPSLPGVDLRAAGNAGERSAGYRISMRPAFFCSKARITPSSVINRIAGFPAERNMRNFARASLSQSASSFQPSERVNDSPRSSVISGTVTTVTSAPSGWGAAGRRAAPAGTPARPGSCHPVRACGLPLASRTPARRRRRTSADQTVPTPEPG